jgi:hypothetical protein
MEAAVRFGVPAVEVGDRLAGERAVVCVCGLIEHGGGESLQPTLFRLASSRANQRASSRSVFALRRRPSSPRACTGSASRTSKR